MPVYLSLQGEWDNSYVLSKKNIKMYTFDKNRKGKKVFQIK